MMFADDIELVRYAAGKYGPLKHPIVEVGGLVQPTIADYSKTIEAMKTARTPEEIHAAQHARYLQIERPLSFLGDYIIENPETGGLPVEELFTKYRGEIETAIALSTFEHVSDPSRCVRLLRGAMMTTGIVIVSVPWTFPHHPGNGEDNWRFSPTGLRHLFARDQWNLVECDWRLDIPADAGVLDIHTGRPQAIQSCYAIARAR